MPDRRSRNDSSEELYPNAPDWAQEIWRDRDVVKLWDGGAGLIREAAKRLGLSEEQADEALKR